MEPCHCGHTTWAACSHKEVINIIITHDISIHFKVLHEKWQKLCLIEAILGYLDFPHKQRLKAVQVNFICYFCRGVKLFEWNFVVPQGGVGQVRSSSASSKVIGGHYLVNQKVKYVCDPVYHYWFRIWHVIGWIMASPVPACCLSQYYHFSQFSGIGVVGSWCVQVGEQYKVLWNLSLCLVYVKSTGMEASSWGLCEGECGKGAEEVKALPHYAQDGEVGLFMHISCYGKYKFFLRSGW